MNTISLTPDGSIALGLTSLSGSHTIVLTPDVKGVAKMIYILQSQAIMEARIGSHASPIQSQVNSWRVTNDGEVIPTVIPGVGKARPKKTSAPMPSLEDLGLA